MRYYHPYSRRAKIYKFDVSRTVYNVGNGNIHSTAGGCVIGATIL